jgi:hypothetical protein
MSAANLTLYEHCGELAALLALEQDAIDCGDEGLKAFALAEIRQELANTREKVERVGKTLANFEATADAALKEATRLQARAERAITASKRLEGYVLEAMSLLNTTRLEGATVTLAARLNPPSLQIDNPRAIPADFLDLIQVEDQWKPRNADIKAALKRGEEVPGCRLTQGSRLERK